jgi:DNA helicase-2/ATP-dependent DNA helicase PcrA
MNLNDLNAAQREAVLAHDGPVLVLAGAGSGKTRVITYRVAHLLQERLAKPWEILAVTFTNKAAGEMRERIHALLGGKTAELTLGTFHAFGARFLRRHADAFGRTPRFGIYDEEDQNRLIRSILKQSQADDRSGYLQSLKKFVDRVKSGLKKPESDAAEMQSPMADQLVELYYKYENALRDCNAFDFDDLISLPCRLLQQNEKLRDEYRARFRFVLIDEFQDTNFPQGELARLLAAPSGNITAVGDDDQSIYGWRGAWIGNILQFERDYRGVRTFRLEQNYRSTQAILEAAHQVIQNNQTRHAKKLWTSRQGGEKPKVLPAADDRQEAYTVVERIQELLNSDHRYRGGDVAILYRTNAQSRALEDALRRNALPYVIVGGLRFYERKEVKDFLAFLKLLVNPSDLLSLQRVINLPPRGIGGKTVGLLSSFAAAQGIPLLAALQRAAEVDGLSKRASAAVGRFAQWIGELRQFAQTQSLHKVGERLLFESELLDYYKKDDPTEAENRRDNLSELLNALREYSFESPRTGLEDLENFLQEVALVTDIDAWSSDGQAVTLMTLHAAKGLEFPVVFLTGLEDGLFPLQNSISDPDTLEEERRLFYVGATRAKDLLFFTYARNRMRWGQELAWQRVSRFLTEIPDPYIEQIDGLTEKWKPEAAELFAKTKERARRRAPGLAKETPTASYPIGSRVRHSQFGEGVILKSEGQGKGLRVLVNFEACGEKLLLAEIAKLEQVREAYDA